MRKFLIALLFTAAGDALAALEIQAIASGLDRPVAITHAGDGSGRLFITLQTGQVVIHNGRRRVARPYLNISSRISCCGEQGLLSIAFHPRYADNGYFYANYTDLNGDTIIARYRVSSNPNRARHNSEVTVLKVRQPFANHNGGQLQFGPDGYLYIGMGDGGSSGDPGNRAQNLKSLLGKVLRIDIDRSRGYRIPIDNPFFGSAGARPEIWALGLRNPWRFSFDRSSGAMFIGDVGQNHWEEVNFQAAGSRGGQNYGWRRMEGRHCFRPPSDCNRRGLSRPIIEYSHTAGCSVTGGYRYRGNRIPGLVCCIPHPF